MTKKYNILLITDIYMGMAGSERNITQLMTGIDKKRFQLYTACIYSGQLAQATRAQGHAVFDLRRGSIYSTNGLKNIMFLRELILKEKISLIVTYHEASDFYGLVLSKICNIPIITSRRDMGFKTRPHHRMAYRLTGRFFDGVITVSQAVKEEIIRQGWFPAERIIPIYNGVAVNEYSSKNSNADLIKKQIGIQPNCSIIGLIANLRSIKGIRYFIEAAAIIRKKHLNVEFIIIGGTMKDPDCTQEKMKLLAKRMDVDQHVHFLGKRDDIAELISLFDIAVVASLSEGFSNTLIEYMASSKPVVATSVGGNPEAVVHGETGLLVPPGDPWSLSAAILSILQNKEAALRFGTAGRKRAKEKFSLVNMIKNYEDFFEQVIIAEQKKGEN